MLRVIWMVVEGLLASIGLIAIAISIKAIMAFPKNLKLCAYCDAIEKELFGDKQD